MLMEINKALEESFKGENLRDRIWGEALKNGGSGREE